MKKERSKRKVLEALKEQDSKDATTKNLDLEKPQTDPRNNTLNYSHDIA
jgi:hypothetical protein